MTLKAVLFDLGGTLLHYHDPQSEEPQRPFRRITRIGVSQLCEQLTVDGFSIPDVETVDPVVDRHIGEAYRATLENLHGGSVENPIRAALAALGINVSDMQWESLRPYFYSAIDPIVTPREGLIETLTGLRDLDLQIGLISNTYWASDVHDRHLAEHGLLPFFPVRVYSCDAPVQKPHPAIFLHALGLMQIRPEEAAYVGDRLDVDVAGAKSAGMRGILIRSPYLPDQNNDIEPDAIIDELPDLLQVVEWL
jgi:HAD superfamily hydrolase (TIGR01509 family)